MKQDHPTATKWSGPIGERAWRQAPAGARRCWCLGWRLGWQLGWCPGWRLGWRRLRPWGVAGLLLAAGCGPPPPGTASRPFFSDGTAASGIDFRLVSGAAGEHYLIETHLGGLGFLDFDNDGDHDLYAVNGHAHPERAAEPGEEIDHLYRNDGSGHFADATSEAGTGDPRYGLGIAAGDADGDGNTDILVTNFGRNTLYRNDLASDGGEPARPLFKDVTEAAGLTHTGFNTSAAWFDLDRDGDLDLFVVRYLRYDPATSKRCREGEQLVYCHPRFFPGEPDLLYRNLGGGRFEEIGARAGIARGGDQEGKGLGVAVFDFNGDGCQDIFVANDTTPNCLWRSNGDGTFTDVAGELGAALSAEGRPQAGMGVDVADANGDASSDIHVTNFSHELNSLYLGSERGPFNEKSRQANLGMTFAPLGFGTLFVDLDLDGDQDLVNANGHVNDLVEKTDPGTGSTYKQRPALLVNDGTGRFEDGAGRGGPILSRLMVGRGLARADIDGDGDPDLALATLDQSIFILKNENPAGNRSLTLKLIGTRSPGDAYGARVLAEIDGKVQLFHYQSARSYLSASDPRLFIGMGQARRVDRLTIHWPSGKVEELRDVAAGAHAVTEPE